MTTMGFSAIERTPLTVVERSAGKKLVMSETTEILVFELAFAAIADGSPVADVVSAEVVLGNDVEGPVSTGGSALLVEVVARGMAVGCMSRMWASGSMMPGLDRSIGAWRRVFEIAAKVADMSASDASDIP